MSLPMTSDAPTAPVIDNSGIQDEPEPKAQGIALVIMLVAVLPYIALASYLASTITLLQEDSDSHSVLSSLLPNLGVFGNLALCFGPGLALAIFVSGANGKKSSEIALRLSVAFAVVVATGIFLNFLPA